MVRKRNKIKGVAITPFDEVMAKLMDYVTDQKVIDYTKLDKILYEDYIISEFSTIEVEYTGGHIVDLLNKMLNKLEPSKSIKVVQWLYKDHLNALYITDDKKQKFLLDGLFINVLKELLWMCYYITTKSASKIKLLGNPIECLCRLQGVYLTLTLPTKDYDVCKRKYVINALSLKDSRYELLPFPEQLDPSDLEMLLIENGLTANADSTNTREPDLFWAVRSLGKDPCSAYERYHVFRFVKNLVKDALDKKSTN